MVVSSVCSHDRVALVFAVMLILWLLLHESKQVTLRSEVLQKESGSLVVGNSALLSASNSSREEHLPIQNDNSINQTSNIAPGALSACELECRVTKENLPPMTQNHNLDYDSGSADVIFLLGYPYTGTSAAHFLLSTSANVSTLTGFKSLSPKEEGWSLTNMKKQLQENQRWDGSLTWVDWNQLAQSYGDRWARNKGPLKVENSPPEIQAPKALKDTFEPLYGKVKFILLVRGDCTYSYHQSWEERVAGYRKVETSFPEDTFVLRFEDLCLSWNTVYADLIRWEPLLADVNISAIPAEFGHPHNAVVGKRGSKEVSHHRTISIHQYCEPILSRWESDLPPRWDNRSMYLRAAYGYDKTNTC